MLYYGLTAQTLGVAAVAVTAAVTLFPGALTPSLRDAIMSRFTYGYQEARWTGRVTPPEAIIMSTSRAYALYPRPFLIPRCAACGVDALLNLSPENLRTPNLFLFPEYPVTATVKFPYTVIGGPETLLRAARNPHNAGTYSAIAWRVDNNRQSR